MNSKTTKPVPASPARRSTEAEAFEEWWAKFNAEVSPTYRFYKSDFQEAWNASRAAAPSPAPEGWPRFTKGELHDYHLEIRKHLLETIANLRAEIDRLSAPDDQTELANSLLSGFSANAESRVPSELWVAFDAFGNPYAVAPKPEHISCPKERIKRYIATPTPGGIP